jgi:hypothetical protein
MAEQPGISIFTPPRQPATNASPATVTRQDAQVRSSTAVDGTQSNPTITPAQARWQADQRELARQDPWRSDAGTIITKNADGTLNARPRAGDGTSAAADTGGQPQPQPGQAAVADGKLVVGDLASSSDDIKSILAAKAQRDSRAALTPATADGFTLNLPEDFQYPPGTDGWQWDLGTPHAAAQLGSLKQWAHANQLDQNSFSQLLAIYAGHSIAEEARFSAAKAAEVGKLGSAAAARVDSVNVWLEARLGSQLAGAMRQMMHTAKVVEGFENLMRSFSSQGVGGNPGGARDGASSQPAKISDEAYAKLSYTEKQAYAQRFDQTRFNGGG